MRGSASQARRLAKRLVLMEKYLTTTVKFTTGLLGSVLRPGDVIDICDDAFFETHGKPDVIITDPPRAGMHEKLVRKLLEMEAPTIVYVSCNSATQARDLALMDSKYKVSRVRPVDMFPQTHHVENVVLLEKR